MLPETFKDSGYKGDVFKIGPDKGHGFGEMAFYGVRRDIELCSNFRDAQSLLATELIHQFLLGGQLPDRFFDPFFAIVNIDGFLCGVHIGGTKMESVLKDLCPVGFFAEVIGYLIVQYFEEIGIRLVDVRQFRPVHPEIDKDFLCDLFSKIGLFGELQRYDEYRFSVLVEQDPECSFIPGSDPAKELLV
jgi:hypothetical protein